MVAGVLRPRRVGAGGKGGRCGGAHGDLARGAGGIAGRAVRGRPGSGLLPLDPGADPLLRRVLRLGVVGSADVPHPFWAISNWRTAVWHLRAPVLRALFQQVSDPGRLQPLGLVEVLDWTAAALNRVDRTAFFTKFGEGEAVPYFYEPFLQAFDPELRKQLGVWYTPPEVVRYMVARVDKALKDDLGIDDGLAGENVYVLDPCCGTGAYLAEVLRRIAANLENQGTWARSPARG